MTKQLKQQKTPSELQVTGLQQDKHLDISTKPKVCDIIENLPYIILRIHVLLNV